MFPRGSQYLFTGHHDAQVDDFVIITLQDDADDVFANIVDIALNRRHQDLAGSLIGSA